MFEDSDDSHRGTLLATWFLALVALHGLAACGGGSSSSVDPVSAAQDSAEGDKFAAVDDAELTALVPSDAALDSSVVMATNFGEIRILLDVDRAPGTVANFLGYVDAGHYDQTIFHRVIPGFMIQGGGFTVGYQRNSTAPPIRNEADNGLANDRYTVAMARTPLAHSATDQFFINVADNPSLNFSGATNSAWGYAVFGRVVEGFDVIDKIASVATGAAGPFVEDAPVELVTISGIERE